jgi:hypothetical protein
MIPVKVAVFAPVGCVTAGAASCVSPPECVPGPVAGVANGLMTGAAVVAFAPVSELMDTPRVAFGEESILRNVYRAIAG